jgi:hypothetical protein
MDSLQKYINIWSAAAGVVLLTTRPRLFHQTNTRLLLLRLEQSPLNDVRHHFLDSLLNVGCVFGTSFFELHLSYSITTLCP